MILKNGFDKNFFWGVSSSALQTEGTHQADGKGKSIWDCFANQSGKIKGGHKPIHATNFYKYYRQDINFINWMNCKNFRFSISWSRIFPQGIGEINLKGVDYYNRLIDACLELGINPWITIYHWDLPMELQKKGGWTNRDILFWFEEYLTFILKNYADRVKNWMILNEPLTFTALGYFMGVHAPGQKGLKHFLPSMHHAALAQAEGGRLVKSYDGNLNVGTTFSFSKVEAYSKRNRDHKAAIKVDALLNKLFLEPLLGLGYPLKILSGLKKVDKYFVNGDDKRLAFDFDFIGVQNYGREVVAYSYFTPIVNARLITAKKRKVPRTSMGWEYFPDGMYGVLKKLNAYENMPQLIVTESGVAVPDRIDSDGKINDEKRIEYLKRSIASVKKAKSEGVNVNGFFVWALTDNFEWAEGYHPRFGLIYIDYKKQKRIPKNSAFWLKEFLGG